MPIITQVYAREVLDSRGNPTVEVEELNEDNATILNDATDEELQMLIYRIYQNLGLI